MGRLYASASRSASLPHLGSESGGRFNRAACMYMRYFSEIRVEYNSHADADDTDDTSAGDAIEHSPCPAFSLCSLQTQPHLILLTTL